MEWTVTALDEDHWQTLRRVRLAALTDAPNAFWASLDTEAGYTERDWRAFLRKSVWFVATEDGRPLGIAGGIPACGEREEPELIGMWVALEARRHGIGLALIHAVEQWALSCGAPAMALWVVTGNDAARRLYETAGYRPTGQREAIPHDPDRMEVRMRRSVPRQH